jgi:hypothetical protein
MGGFIRRTMKKHKEEPKEVAEMKVVPSFTGIKLVFAIKSLYEKVANHTGKTIPELYEATIIINKGEISIK